MWHADIKKNKRAPEQISTGAGGMVAGKGGGEVSKHVEQLVKRGGEGDDDDEGGK